jgi:pyruvate dehydrogenase E2 component (dihydrolipoamide acetyltransferase)
LPAFTEVPHSMMRKVIARRLTESKRDAPHFYLTIDCNIDRLLQLRQEINAKREKDKISVNDFVIKAAALALRQVPASNASWTENAVRLYQAADVSVAVATPGGLITPIIRNADTKTPSVISGEMRDLAARARENKLKPEEYQGGTFSVSNLGMFGIREFAAVINPPQGAILAVGAGEQRPIVKDNALAIATMMTATLSVDHRVVDGVIGAEFLAAFKKLIEDPLTMLV